MGKHRLLAAAIAAVLLGAVAVPLAFAQTTGGEGLEVKPAIIEDKVNPGETYRFSVTVKNISSSPRTLTMSTKDISGLDASGHPIFAPKGQETTYSLSTWIRVPTAPIVLGAGESRTVALTAQVPKNASPGAHFGGVFFDYAAQPQNSNGSAISIQVGDVISLQIAGDIVEDARIRQFSTDRLIYGAPSVVFTTKVENMGNVLERPRGLIQIADMSGKQVASIPVNDALAPVFPGAVRAYAASWNDNGFAIGRYQATLSLSYGDSSKRTISATTSFWVIPFKLTVSVIGGLLLLILLIYLWVRRYLKKQLSAMGVSTTAKDADLDYYGRKYNKTGSRLALVTAVVLLLSILLLVILFILFA